VPDSSRPAPRRLIIIPAYNEADNLPSVIPKVRATAPDYDLIVVDDGSCDQTAVTAAELGAIVVSLPVNLGYGGAVQTGFRYAVRHNYDLAVVIDADGQHDPDGIMLLADTVARGEADVAVGSRFRGRMDYRQGWVRRLGMRLFAWTVSRITGRQITDPTSGYQALNADALRFFAKDNYPVDYPDADTLLILHYAGFTVTEVPVTMRERLSGVPMHSGLKPIYYVGKMWLAIAMVLLRQKTRASARRREP
jgi:glycosyltransferase involved in cell wall biosynthesis